MTRNPKLAPLATRLTKNQKRNRRVRMHARGSFREQTEQTLARHQGGFNAIAQVVGGLHKAHTTTRRLAYLGIAMQAVYYGALVGRMLRWW